MNDRADITVRSPRPCQGIETPDLGPIAAVWLDALTDDAVHDHLAQVAERIEARS